LHDQIITRIKVLARLRTDEHLSAQDGKMQLKLEAEELDIRVSIVPVVDGEKAVLRLLSEKSRQFSLSDLGMEEKDLEKVKNGFSKPYGMVLSTGPTGSGKTTTMYAILKILNTRERNISTIEDPVEYEMEGVNQIQVNPKTNLTFADGLRSILRQDPDTIFVGEIRDKETAGIAINSAMTGHMVLSTLHTNDAATALPRLIDMDIEPFLVSSTVNVIIAQRLVRKLCTRCIESYTITPDLVERLRTIIGDTEISQTFYRSHGCEECGMRGYKGRIGIFEILEISEEMRGLIIKHGSTDEIIRMGVANGMTPLIRDGLNKASGGLTSLEEVLRVVRE
jgi:type II secretory ATPase GspE/PulE/Tfp pilus assembly ATPase PilB-like protein